LDNIFRPSAKPPGWLRFVEAFELELLRDRFQASLG
jgi:hypothetical protein